MCTETRHCAKPQTVRRQYSQKPEPIKTAIETLQSDLDEWINFYNTDRPHTGRYCFDKTPLQTWQDSKSLSQNKDLKNLFHHNSTFSVLREADAGTTEEQPVSNISTNENDKAVVLSTAFNQKSFLL